MTDPSFEMNMMIMYHVHQLHTDMESKKPTKVPENNNQAAPVFLL